MKKLLLSFMTTMVIFAQNQNTDNNATKKNINETNSTKEINKTTDSNDSLAQKHIQEQIEREKKYKEEQKFYQGEDYNLKEHEVDTKTVDKVPLIEPEYDFDITDLYAD